MSQPSHSKSLSSFSPDVQNWQFCKEFEYLGDFVDDVDFLRLLPNFLVFVVVVLVDFKEGEVDVEWEWEGDEGLDFSWDVLLLVFVVVVVNFLVFLVANFLIFLEGVFGVVESGCGGGGGGVTESLEVPEEGVGEGLGDCVRETSPDFKAFLNLCLGV